jgi:starch-binding outer membrane protein, SusD/RagB family
MKKYIILGLIGLGILIYSCTKVLDQTPKGAISSVTLEDSTGGEALVISCYSILNNLNPQPAWGSVFGENLYNPASNWESGDLRSGDCYKGGGGTGDVQPIGDIENNNIAPINETFEDIWRAYFYAVSRCNKTLQIINAIPDNAYAQKQNRIAEVKVLRGWFYYHLKLHYRTFPWITDTVAIGTEQLVPNNLSEAQLWANIINDFNAGINLPVTDRNRINKYVANSLLCKAYMFNKDYADASKAADVVLNSGLYHLQTDLQGLYSDPAQEAAGENIFSLAVNLQTGASNNIRFNWGDLWVIPPTPYGGGDGFDRPSFNLVNAFKVDANGLPLLDTYNNTVLGQSDTTTPIDPRLDISIGRPGITWKDYTPTPYLVTWCRTYDYYGPFSKKKNCIYVNSPFRGVNGVGGFPWAGGSLDFPFIRISDIMLLKSEALIEMNQDLDQARNLINLIRQRAASTPWVMSFYVPGKFAANYKIGLYPSISWTQDYARKAVRFERRLELCLEGQHFFDLVRWGVTVPELSAYYATEQSRTNSNHFNSPTYSSDRTDYYPVPQTEIDLSKGVLKQDPHYQ